MGSTGWGWLSKGQVSRTQGALMPRTEAEGPVCASSQPHSPPTAQLPNSLCCAPSLPHPGVSRRARSGRHQHHRPGLRASLQTVPQEPAQARYPPRQVRGQGGGGWVAPSQGPQTRTGKGGLLFPHSSSEKGREGNNLSAPASCYS